MDGMDTDDPFASLGGLGSGLGANFGPRTAPFRSQSFNVGSHTSAGKKNKVQDPPVEHDLYVSLDDINKVRSRENSKANKHQTLVGRNKKDENIPASYSR